MSEKLSINGSSERLLFSFWDSGWGHFARVMAIAAEAKKRGHEVGFITSAKFAKEIGEAALADTITIIPNRHPNIQAPPYELPVYSHAFRHAQRQLGLRFNDTDWLRGITQREIAAIDEFKPDIIVNDYRDTIRTAAQVRGVPVAGITHSSGNIHGKRLGWWVDPENATLPDCRQSFNQIREELGLDPIVDERELFSGDINLIPSIAEIDPLAQHSPESHYVGKLAWQPKEHPFTPLDSPDLLRKVFSYVGEKTRPQYGYEEMLTKVILDSPKTGFYVVGDMDRYPDPALVQRQKMGSALIKTFISAEHAVADSDVLLTHGGHGSVMVAISHGKPILGIGPYQTDGSNTLKEIESHGAGKTITHSEESLTRKIAPDLGKDISIFGYWKSDITPEMIKNGIDDLLNNPDYARNAKRLQAQLLSRGGAVEAVDIIEDTI